MDKIFDKHFVIFAVILCSAIGIFLAQKSPQYAPFSVDSHTISANLAQTQRPNKSKPKSAILPNAQKSAHSSSIADLGENLMVVYFAGSREGASDVAIMQHFIDKDSFQSTPQRAILDAKMLSLMSGKFIKKLGNPVIFRDKNGALHLFVVGVSLGGWATSKIYQLRFRADLQRLDFVGELHLGLLANFSHLVRTPPIALENGGFALPYYHELARKYALVGFFDENAKFTRALRLNRLKNQLQPTIIALNESECLAFFRNHKAHNNDSFLQQCSDFGAVWGTPKATNLKGYDDSALLVSYTNAQNAPRILLIYNDGRRLENGAFADTGSTRQSLGLYALENAVGDLADKDLAQGDLAQGADILAFSNARFSTNFAFLQNIDTVSVAHPNEVSYPSAVISGEWLFVAYTHNRKNIKIMRFDLAHLEAQIAQMSRESNRKLNRPLRHSERSAKARSEESKLCESKGLTNQGQKSITHRFTQSERIACDTQIAKVDTSLHCVLLSMTSGGADSLGMMNGLDCHDLPLASLAMTKITTPSLRGSLSDSENNEAIHKNKIDCHDSAKPNLAMTAWDRLPRKSYKFAEFAKTRNDEKIAWEW